MPMYVCYPADQGFGLDGVNKLIKCLRQYTPSLAHSFFPSHLFRLPLIINARNRSRHDTLATYLSDITCKSAYTTSYFSLVYLATQCFLFVCCNHYCRV